MRIIVYGLPGPQGSKKFMGKTSQGKAIMLENSNKVIPWRNAVMVAAQEELDRIGRPAPLDGPLMVVMVFTFLRPASVKRSKRLHPSVFPDLSKIVRSTEDALTQAGVWRDDALVVDAVTRKRYANEDAWALDRAGCLIDISPVVPLELPPGRGYLELEAPHVR
jgi:Holliday junction resolvase RusA-like endonuclease